MRRDHQILLKSTP